MVAPRKKDFENIAGAGVACFVKVEKVGKVGNRENSLSGNLFDPEGITGWSSRDAGMIEGTALSGTISVRMIVSPGTFHLEIFF